MTLELGWVELQAGRVKEARAPSIALASVPDNDEARAGAVAADLAVHDLARRAAA
jgi:hypothetical protein